MGVLWPLLLPNLRYPFYPSLPMAGTNVPRGPVFRAIGVPGEVGRLKILYQRGIHQPLRD